MSTFANVLRRLRLDRSSYYSQDLTGQLIKKVVGLLEHTEKDLLKLLIDAAPQGAISQVKKEELLAGPGAPGRVALGQAAVDDLLADLGF